MTSREANDGIAREFCACHSVRFSQRRCLVVHFVSSALRCCGGRAFYKSRFLSRALFGSFGNGYARLKRCAGDDLSSFSSFEGALCESNAPSPRREFSSALARSRVSECAIVMTARGQAGQVEMPNRARAPIHWRSSEFRLSPPWNAAAGLFFKCGDLFQTMTDVTIVVLTVGAIFAPLVIPFVGI